MLTKEEKVIMIVPISACCMALVLSVLVKSGVLVMFCITGILLCIYFMRNSIGGIEETIKKDALEHYNRMISWAKKQNPDGLVIRYDMKRAIGESWVGSNCAYCNQMFSQGSICNKCRLYSHNLCKDEYVDSDLCCGGLWFKMANASTWREWIDRAKQVREYIRKNG